MTQPISKEVVYRVGDKEMRLPSGTEILAEGVVNTMTRVEEENRGKASTEIVLDKSNKVSFPGFPYKFEALLGKILVSIDVFKSGYECKECKGKGNIKIICDCEKNGHPGVKYSNEDINTISDTLGSEVADARTTMVCPECEGDWLSKHTIVNCAACKGIGHTIIIPEVSKNLPTSGVVVSLGSDIYEDDDGLTYYYDGFNVKHYLGYKVGDRILFGPYAGNMIPTKAGLMFKIIDATQAWCKIEGGEDLSAFDFIIQA